MRIFLDSRRKYMRKRTNPEGAPASIEDCTVTLAHESYSYTGQPITPVVSVVTDDGVPLTVNTDYLVSYHDNTNVGAGTAVVTGTGQYVGSVTKTFQITSAAPEPEGWDDLDISNASLIETGSIPFEYGENIYKGCGYNDDDIISFISYNAYSIVKISSLTFSRGLSLPLSYSNNSYSAVDLTGVHPIATYDYGKRVVVGLNKSWIVSTYVFDLDTSYDYEKIFDSSNASSSGEGGYNSCYGDASVQFSFDGSKIFFGSGLGSSVSSSYIYAHNLASNYNVSSVNHESIYFNKKVSTLPGDISSTSSNFRGCLFSPDGKKFIVLTTHELYQYNLTTAYDLTNGVTVGGKVDFSSSFPTLNSMSGIVFSLNGNKAVAISNNAKKAYVFSFEPQQ